MGLVRRLARRQALVTSIRAGDGRDPPGSTVAYVRTRGIGWRLNELLCRAALRRHPEVRADWTTVEVIERWHLPLRCYLWKVRFRDHDH